MRNLVPPTIPERLEVLDEAVWYHTPERTVIYRNIDGVSPEITNHISRVNFEVTSGVGQIATKGMVADVKAGDKVSVLRGEPYLYEGEMTLLITTHPGIVPEFVTFNGQPLLKPQAKVLNKAIRSAVREELWFSFANKIVPEVEAAMHWMAESKSISANSKIT